MKEPFGLVLIHGDGTRLLRLSVPRWLAYATLGAALGILAGTAGLSAEHALARRRIEALREQTADQRTVLDAFERQLPAIRSEVASWRALHAKMQKSLDPDAGSVRTASLGDREPAAGVALRPAEELDLVARGVAEERPRLRKLGRLVSRTSRTLNALPLRWPIHGPVNSGYGLRRSPWSGMPEEHHGIDIGSSPGTPVRSPAPGTVVAASAHGRLGKHVTLDHGNGVRSIYGHLEAVEVRAGERVERGQVIGLVGNTGRSTGPHLHYELLVDGKPVDPRGFLGADGRPLYEVVAQTRPRSD